MAIKKIKSFTYTDFLTENPMPTLTTTTPYFSLYEVVDGIYAAVIKPGTGAFGNAGIVNMGNYTLIFDTFATPSAARSLRQIAGEVTELPIGYVLNSHRHADHVLGNMVFRDVPIVAHERNRALMAEMTPQLLGFLREQGNDYLQSLADEIAGATTDVERADAKWQRDEMSAIHAVLDEIELVLPTVTFSNQITFYGAGRTAHFIHCGANHTPGDSVLWLPEDKVLLAGDIVQVRTHPSMGQGDHEQWATTMDRLAALAPQWVIPGHGEVGTEEDIVMMKHYVLDITATARTLAAEGISGEEVIKTPPPASYDGFTYGTGWGRNLQNLLPHYQQD
jgi:cyclase